MPEVDRCNPRSLQPGPRSTILASGSTQSSETPSTLPAVSPEIKDNTHHCCAQILPSSSVRSVTRQQTSGPPPCVCKEFNVLKVLSRFSNFFCQSSKSVLSSEGRKPHGSLTHTYSKLYVMYAEKVKQCSAYSAPWQFVTQIILKRGHARLLDRSFTGLNPMRSHKNLYLKYIKIIFSNF